MFCTNCGNKIDGSAKFCGQCGATVNTPSASAAETSAAEGKKVSPNITLGPDGVYRWTYKMSLFRNPTIFLLVWKILFFSIALVFGFIMVLNGCEGNMTAERFMGDLKLLGIIVAVMTVLSALAMLIYAAIMGGKYIVDFTMDEKGVNHAQAPAQA